VAIAEIGVDMGRFPTPGHLCSWAKYAPGISESAGKKKGAGATGHGNPYLARILGEAAIAVSRTDTFLGERYRRIARRCGAKKAIVALGRSILVIISAPAVRPQRPIPRPGLGLLPHPHQPGTQGPQPHQPTQRPGLPSHPQPSRLTDQPCQAKNPAPLRYAGRFACPPQFDFRISASSLDAASGHTLNR
jgi:hypothetical protein